MAVATDPQVTFAKAVKAGVTLTGIGVESDTVQIGGIIYTFLADPAAAYDVDIKTNATTQAAALVSAINLDGTAGAYYVTGTAAHPHVTAVNAGGVITLTARYAGDWAQAIALVDGMTNGTVGGASFDDITTGTDGAGNISTAVAALKKGANAHLITELDKIINGE